MTRARRLDVILVFCAALAVCVRPPASLVEAWYANGFYPAVDRAVRAVTGSLPICAGDVLFVAALVALVAWWTLRLASAPRGTRLRRAGALAARSAACAALIVLWFAFSWGFNYERVPVAAKVPLHPERATAAAVAALADRTIDALSREAPAAHREHPTDAELARALYPHFLAVIHRLGDVADFPPPRVKPTIFQGYFQASATTGFTDPWTHEVNIDATAYWYERPAYFAHEWAHIAGFADETEANFIAVLTCATSGDPLSRYSGAMLTWFNLPSSAHPTHRISRLAYRDLRDVRDRFRKHVSKKIEVASRAAYDRYLKANHVEAGFESYQLFVRWLTAADFDAAGLPVVKSGATP